MVGRLTELAKQVGDPEVCHAAVKALMAVPLDAIRPHARAVADALVGAGVTAVDGLIMHRDLLSVLVPEFKEVLSNGDSNKRRAALVALKHVSDNASLTPVRPQLEALLRESELMTVRDSVRKLLRSIG